MSRSCETLCCHSVPSSPSLVLPVPVTTRMLAGANFPNEVEVRVEVEVLARVMAVVVGATKTLAGAEDLTGAEVLAGVKVSEVLVGVMEVLGGDMRVLVLRGDMEMMSTPPLVFPVVRRAALISPGDEAGSISGRVLPPPLETMTTA